MKNIYSEAQRGLHDVVKATTSDTWVNKEDKWQEMDRKLAQEFRATPLKASQTEEGTVKDRDIIDGTVDHPEVQDNERVQAVDSNYEVEPVVESDVEVVDNPAFRPDAEAVPTGTIKKVLAWVGDDKDRAQAALDAENADESPRSTLIEKLEDIVLSDEEEN